MVALAMTELTTVSGKMQFDLAGAEAHRADDGLDIVAQLRCQFQHFGFADATELAARDA